MSAYSNEIYLLPFQSSFIWIIPESMLLPITNMAPVSAFQSSFIWIIPESS